MRPMFNLQKKVCNHTKAHYTTSICVTRFQSSPVSDDMLMAMAEVEGLLTTRLGVL